MFDTHMDNDFSDSSKFGRKTNFVDLDFDVVLIEWKSQKISLSVAEKRGKFLLELFSY